MALTEADPLCTTTLRLAKGRIWPAGQALGLRVGDVLLAVDGKPYRGNAAVLRGMSAQARGPLALSFQRGAAGFTVLATRVDFGIWEAAPPPAAEADYPADPTLLTNWEILRDGKGVHDLFALAPALSALVVPFLWMMQKRLWLPLAVFVSALAVGMAVSPFAGAAIYLAAGINLRQMAPHYLRAERRAHGFRTVAVVAARSERAAITAYRALDPAARFQFAPEKASSDTNRVQTAWDIP
jgi:hypothetical protein